MGLLEHQQLFGRLLPQLISKAHELGFEATIGESHRTDEQAEINALGPEGRERLGRVLDATHPTLAKKVRNNGRVVGIRHSVHVLKLAIDLHLFNGTTYLTSTEDHRPLGMFWIALHPWCRWGGDWGDGNHYSLEYDGRK